MVTLEKLEVRNNFSTTEKEIATYITNNCEKVIYSSVRVTADTAALQDANDQAIKIDANKYTKDTYEALTKAVNEAKALLETDYPSKEAVAIKKKKRI